MKKLALLPDLSIAEIEEVKRIAPTYEIIGELDEDSGDVEIVFGWDKNLEHLLKNNHANIKWIQFPYAGVNHLPLDVLNQQNIKLTSGSGTNAHAVAESTLAMILGITRNIIKTSQAQEESEWIVPEDRYELKGKTMLIVGAGNIGERIGALAQAFLMNTIGINRSGRKINYMDRQYRQNDLSNIISQADIVVNILPATDETHHLFDKTLFSKMKDETIFVNVGRGETVVTEDLLVALDQKKVAWAALDVFEEEPLPKNHPLWRHERVFITPHIAGQVERQLDYAFPIFIKNLESYLENGTLPENFVELNRGY